MYFQSYVTSYCNNLIIAQLKVVLDRFTGISGSSPDMDRRFRFKPWTGSWR